MLVQVDSKIQAQRLANAGFTRTGSKAVEMVVDDVWDVLAGEHGDVTVKKLSLARNNGEREADLIDDYIDAGYEGEYKATTAVHSHTKHISASTSRLFELGADSLTIHRAFEHLLEGNVAEAEQAVAPDAETFASERDETLDSVTRKIDDLEETLATYRQLADTLADLEYSQWVSAGSPTVSRSSVERGKLSLDVDE